MNGRRIPFTHEDEERIASAGVWGLIVAVTSIASAVLSTATTVIFTLRADIPGFAAAALIPGMIGLGIAVLLAVWLLQASVAFRKVALTDEADQHYLLEGFGKLRNYFMTMGILFIIGLCAMVLAFCGAMTCGMMMR